MKFVSRLYAFKNTKKTYSFKVYIYYNYFENVLTEDLNDYILTYRIKRCFQSLFGRAST